MEPWFRAHHIDFFSPFNYRKNCSCPLFHSDIVTLLCIKKLPLCVMAESTAMFSTVCSFINVCCLAYMLLQCPVYKQEQVPYYVRPQSCQLAGCLTQALCSTVCYLLTKKLLLWTFYELARLAFTICPIVSQTWLNSVCDISIISSCGCSWCSCYHVQQETNVNVVNYKECFFSINSSWWQLPA